MGPTNIALVKLFQADQQLREAQGRLDAVTRNARIQERKVNDLSEKLKADQHKLQEEKSKLGQLELDIKSRDARIEKLRTQQQNSKTNKEYQAFLVEINTEKVDKAKIEDETMKVMEVVEKGSNEVKELSALLESEKGKLATMKEQIEGDIARLQAEIDGLKPAREEAAKGVPNSKARDEFERLSERFEGEAMSALSKPNRRHEEYICTACNMSLVVDVYNRLHNRDDLVFCPSCRRILYIPDDLPPEVAVKAKPAAKKEKKESAAKEAEAASQQ